MINKVRSLKRQLLLSLGIPLVFFVAADTVLSYYVTQHYVNETYDRWLVDSAKSLVQEIRVGADKAILELPPVALEMFTWDEEDKIHFKIISAELDILAGDAFVPDPLFKVVDWSKPVFFDDHMYGEPVRVVSMRLDRKDTADQVFVHVAETKNKRRMMMRDFLLVDLSTQLLLVLLTGSFLLTGVKRGLQPLQALASEIAQRSPSDLSPTPANHTFLEVRTLTDTINDLLRQLDQAIATQNRFIANAAHQLRTPLAGLKLQAERALREQNPNRIKPALVQIQECADRLSHLVTQLLVLAKSEPIKGGHELKAVDLCLLAREVAMEWAPRAIKRKMELSFEGPRTGISIMGDEILLRELLSNLLDNAICYGYEHGNITVTLKGRPAPCLLVEDDGPGIADHEIEKIFERFYRLQNSPGNGCGLGLAIVKEIADLHQARIEVGHLREQSGTRIKLTFPRAQA
jgi:two-component system sensor histidine kinase TctE